MKYLFAIFFVCLLIGCKSKTTTIQPELDDVVDYPTEGTYHAEIFEESILTIKKDDIGVLYPTIEKGDQLVFKFTFGKYASQNTRDGHYVEEIYAEIDPKSMDFELSDAELKKVKLFFNRSCFCEFSGGQKIVKGHFDYKKHDARKLEITLEFEANDGKQTISKIKETVLLK